MDTKFEVRTSDLAGAFFLAGILAIFAAAAPLTYSQARPTPTPAEDSAVVVSRDEDLERLDEEIDRTKQQGAVERAAARITSVPGVQPGSAAAAVPTSSVTTAAQQRMMFFLEMLTKTEQRAESLRKQLFDLIEKQGELETRIQQVDYSMRPEIIASYTALSGSLNPEDLRDQRRSALQIEKRSLESLLNQLTSSRINLEDSVRKADALVERVRFRFEATLEAALAEDPDFL